MRRPVLTTGWIVFALSAAAAQAAPTGGEDDLEISVPAPPARAQAPAPEANAQLQQQLDDLKQQIASLQAKIAVPAVAPTTKPAEQPPPPTFSETASPLQFPRHGVTLLAGLRLSGYIQGQYQRYDQSQDQLSPSGTPLNEDRFEIRRARVRLTGDWMWAGFMVELDGNTVNGPAVALTRAEASLFARNHDLTLPPFLKATVGLTIIPFGLELQIPENELLFMERTTASQAFFPNRQDVGLTLSGGVGPFLYQLAIMDGDDTGGFTVPPTSHPDFLGRAGVRHFARNFEVAGGVSFLAGTGFAAGSTATKASVTWVDSNNNGQVDTGELVGVSATSAVPSQTFSHWGVNADLEVGLHTPAGWTRLYLEATMASNLDRGLFVANPVTLGMNLREAAFVAALVQDITDYGFVGFRADGYNPDADFLQSQRGEEIITSQTITTLAPAVGLRLPGRARLSFEYDFVLNLLGHDSSGVLTQLQDNDFVVRLQVEL